MIDNDKYVLVEEEIEHPLEDFFDIEPCTTLTEYEERLPAVLVDHELYDDKDKEIEGQIQEVYDLALQAFTNASECVETIDPKYRARNEEVAANYLSLALAAARDKANMKQTKDKISAKQTTGNVTNNNLIMTREDALKMLENINMDNINTTDFINGETVDGDS